MNEKCSYVGLLRHLYRWIGKRAPHDAICLLFVFAICAFSLAPAHAEIKFQDVSQEAGVFNKSPTAASSWGDINSDGWPDLWVSNHHGENPSLYLNQQDGTFVDVAAKLLGDVSDVDFHGAAWGDFDNDGDQDLIVTTGGGAGRGISPNYFFVNEQGRLTNQATSLGLDYPLGRGRTPLWLDANGDGRLDVLLMNRSRADASSALFHQTAAGGFVKGEQSFDAPRPPESFPENVIWGVSEFFSAFFSEKPATMEVSDEFAQLADMPGNGEVELVTYMKPTRIYSVNAAGLDDRTDGLALPRLRAVQDAAVEDFNGDGRLDWYLARARPWVLDVVQTDAKRLQGKISNKPQQSRGIEFKTEGDVTFAMYQPWMDPSDPKGKIKPTLFIGAKRLTLVDPVFTVSPSDPDVRTPAPSVAENGESISVQFDAASNLWALKSSVPLISFIITSSRPIESFQATGFKPSKGGAGDALLVSTGNGFVSSQAAFTKDETACGSVVAADFDNDMDVDLYLVCTAPTENLSNILYENDGRGNFVRVAAAGGAEGSRQGRGNQVVTADYNRDGFLDLFVTNGSGPPPFAAQGPHQLFRNQGNDNHWLQIDLQGAASNRDGTGAKVILETGGKRQVRLQGGGMHSFSQNHARIHFGLGTHQQVDSLTIHWPSGAVQQLNDVPADQILLVKESATDR